MSEKCVECKEKRAFFWNKQFCEDCYRKILNDSLTLLNEDIDNEQELEIV